MTLTRRTLLASFGVALPTLAVTAAQAKTSHTDKKTKTSHKSHAHKSTHQHASASHQPPKS